MPLSLVGVVWVTVNNFCTFRKCFCLKFVPKQREITFFSYLWQVQSGPIKNTVDQKLRFVLWCYTLNDYKAFLWVTIGKDDSFSDRNLVRIYFWREIKLIFVIRREIPRIVKEFILEKKAGILVGKATYFA